MKSSVIGMEKRTGIFVEGSKKIDVVFHAKWLLEISSVEKHYAEAKRDPQFVRDVATRLEVLVVWDFALEATLLMSTLMRGEPIVLETGSHESEVFAVLAQIGFFSWTLDRYRLSLPPAVTLATVKSAALNLIATQDEEYRIFPEKIISVAPMTALDRLLLIERHQLELDVLECGQPN